MRGTARVQPRAARSHAAIVVAVVMTALAMWLGTPCSVAQGSPDGDADGVPDAVDNCLHVANLTQEDADLDGAGDACDCNPYDAAIGNCDDGNVCTDDACDAALGCSYANNAVACDDGNACTTTTGDACVSGFCAATTEQTSVSAGWETSCAVRSDATLECWGRNDYGQASGPNGSTDTYTAVSAGNYHTCALRTDGRLACWGQNGMGQVSGPNGSTDTYQAVSVLALNSTCALRVDGRLRCWGLDGPNASTDIHTAVDGGQSHVCALRVDGRLACWGFDGQGRVSGPNASTDLYAAVSAGSHTCAVRTDGLLACWGIDAQGQVSGPNASTDRYIAVSAGANGNGANTCAIRTDGRLACWGPDGCGRNSGPNASTERYTGVSAGGLLNCGLRSDGQLTCWGCDSYQEVSGPNASRHSYGFNRLDWLNCDDGSVCTDDACAPSSGCVHTTPEWATCDDGDACTVGVCDDATGCEQTPLDCDDGNGCTDDTCDAAIGCVHTPNVLPCDDGDACTRTDVCAVGVCVGGNPVVCTALDQCHVPGACDPATGICSNPNQPDGAVCTDDDWCTTGDACQTGVCTPAFNGLDQFNPRSNGYYKRLCRGPHGGDQLTDADAACVAQVTATFAGISTVAQICEVIEPSKPNNDTCGQTEDDLMVLALNICRARVCIEQSIDSQCGSNGNVGQSLAESDAILDSPSRNFDTCGHAKCLDEEINTGRALELNSLTLSLEAGFVRLTWTPPLLNDDGAPTGYDVWRRPQASLSPFTKIGEATSPTFLDTTAQTGDWEYEITAVMR